MRNTGTLLSQCSDVRCTLERIDRRSYERTLKTHLLLFDHIRIPATQLLSNRVLQAILLEKAVAEACLLPSGEGAASPLQPVSFGYDNFGDVAQVMIDSNTEHSLPTNESLVNHAAHLDSMDHRFTFCKTEEFRPCFWQLFVEAIPLLMESPNWIPKEREGLRALHHWLLHDADREHLTQNAVNRFLATRVSEAFRLRLMLLTDTAYQFAFSTLDHGFFGSPKDNDGSLFVDVLYRVQARDLPAESRDEEADKAVDELYAEISLSAVVDTLPINLIVELRRADAFVALRSAIERIAGEEASRTPELAYIHEALSGCQDALEEVLRHRYKQHWKSYLKKLENEATGTRVRGKLEIGRALVEVFSLRWFDVAIRSLDKSGEWLTRSPVNDRNLAHLKWEFAKLQDKLIDDHRTPG